MGPEGLKFDSGAIKDSWGYCPLAPVAPPMSVKLHCGGSSVSSLFLLRTVLLLFITMFIALVSLLYF